MRSFAHCSSSATTLPSSGRGKAALRREAELIESNELRRLLDAALDCAFAFQRAGFAGDEPEHHRLALGHEAQGFEAAGAFGVIFHEIAVHVNCGEEKL